MKFARSLLILVAAVLATLVGMSVSVLAAQVIGTAQDMVIEVSQGHLVRIDRAASVVFVARAQ